MELPATVKARIKQVWGAQGSEWADRFPETLLKACANWSLTDLRPLPNLSYHFVAAARMGAREVVLKLGVPEPEFFQEAAALEAFGSNTCVELIEQAPDLAAMILERAMPGASLDATWSAEKDEGHTRILAKAMSSLWKAPVTGFPTVLDWAKVLENAGSLMPESMLRRAQQLVWELHASSDTPMFLHGDLHHGNVLQSGDAWKVIDPKGVVGDPAFEVYALLRNPVEASSEFTLKNWERRIEIVAEVTGLERSRLLKGAHCGTVISCCWSAEEGGDPPEADLELARRLEAAIC